MRADLKILLIGDYPPPHGGVAVHVRQLHDAFRGGGLHAEVLDIGKGGRPAPDVFPVRTAAGYVAALARRAADGFTFHLHTSGNNPKAWAVALATAAVPGAGKVITLHSGLVPAFLERSAANRALAWTALAGFDRIVAVSEAVRDAVLLLGVPAEKVVVQPAFCASSVVAGEPPPKLAQARERRSPLIAVAHHPSPVYGRALVLQALPALVRRYPDAGVALFGPGSDGDDLWDAARAARVEGLVESFGELEHAQALALIRRCDVFLRPTTADGDAISVREALALGVPCVASDVAARPAGTITFRAGDATDLVAKVCEAVARGRVEISSPDAVPVLLELYRSVRGAPASAGGAAAAA